MTDFPAEEYTEAAELPVDDLFGLLGSEPRMEIMEILWDDFEFQDYVTESLAPMSFSELRDRSGSKDPGNFNYHLRALTDVTIDRTDDGYQLTPLGYNLMRMIERYGSFEYHEIAPTALERPCPFCGGELVGRYERELVHVHCPDCWGIGDEGTINYVQIPSSTHADYELSRLLEVGTMEIESRIRYAAKGICPECYATLDRELEVCSNHDVERDGRCPSCNLRYAMSIVPTCDACRWGGAGPLVEVALIDPRVRDAFDQCGRGPRTAGSWSYRLDAFGAVTEDIEGQDPPVVTYRFEIDGDEVAFRIDGESLTDRVTVY